eukprot:TRINITY_DN8579_c0_g2_i1.p1 TRINITY_DN8579_c0_g2~~TRINITY_DN8579_c0_g2_i1.p1  ORF type:complete len:321 (+),score=48.57 TRINITY_DN8579_c0_g2_i1:87-965(+)
MDDKLFFKVARLLMSEKRATALRREHVGDVIGEGASRPACSSETITAEREFGKTGEDHRDERVTYLDFSMDLLPGACPANEITSDARLNSHFDEAGEDRRGEGVTRSDFSINGLSGSVGYRDDRVTSAGLSMDLLRGVCHASEITSDAKRNSHFDEAVEDHSDEGVTRSDVSKNRLSGSMGYSDERVTFFEFSTNKLPGADKITSDMKVHAGVAFTDASSSCADVASRSNPRRMMSRGVGQRLALYDTPHPRLYLNEVGTDDDDDDDDEEDDSFAPSFCNEPDSASPPAPFS